MLLTTFLAGGQGQSTQTNPSTLSVPVPQLGPHVGYVGVAGYKQTGGPDQTATPTGWTLVHEGGDGGGQVKQWIVSFYSTTQNPPTSLVWNITPALDAGTIAYGACLAYNAGITFPIAAQNQGNDPSTVSPWNIPATVSGLSVLDIFVVCMTGQSVIPVLLDTDGVIDVKNTYLIAGRVPYAAATGRTPTAGFGNGTDFWVAQSMTFPTPLDTSAPVLPIPAPKAVRMASLPTDVAAPRANDKIGAYLPTARIY